MDVLDRLHRPQPGTAAQSGRRNAPVGRSGGDDSVLLEWLAFGPRRVQNDGKLPDANESLIGRGINKQGPGGLLAPRSAPRQPGRHQPARNMGGEGIVA